MRFAALFFAAGACFLACAQDRDQDGLQDDFEQALLVRFAPAFHISAQDCDVAPAEFLPGSRQPKAVAKNGTIYGQVLRNGERLEIHYYHLWNRDCGRAGHALDAEHVSVLIQAEGSQESASNWKAVYWYAAAHQKTVCDTSSGSTAAALGAENHGPDVWISRGKHASFLSLNSCARGCGGDRCDQMRPLAPSAPINIGEPGAYMNGAVWAASALWPLASKMSPDFGEPVLEQLRYSTGVVLLGAPSRRMQAVISVSGAPIDALATGNKHTEAALSLADQKTDSALNTGVKHVDKSLRVARRKVARWLKIN